jgi:Skp family chaperone for outer membrane proteins
MNKNIKSGLLALCFLAFSSSGFAADFKIATVDLRKVFDTYYKTIQASLANSNRMVERDRQLTDMMDSRKRKENDWRQEAGKAEDQAVPPEERAKHKSLAKDIEVELQIQSETISNFYARTELQRRDEMVQHVTDLTAEIRSVMEAMAKKQGFTMVLDRTALTMTGNPLVLYTSGDNDLTDALLKELNSAAPPEPAPDTNRSTNTLRLPPRDAKPPPTTPPPK